LADERDGVHRDALAADVVAVRFGDRADGDLPDLRAAAHDDDPLAVDRLERVHDLHAAHDVELLERRDERLGATREADLEVDAVLRRALARDRDRRDVATLLRDDAGELMEHTGPR